MTSLALDLGAVQRATSKSSSRSDQGAALIIVLSVLMMLFVIATPFLLSAKNDYRNALASSERFRARAAADAALEWSKHELGKTSNGLESRGLGRGTPYWDSPAELTVNGRPDSWGPALGLEDASRFLRDPRGLLWGIEVRDEQSLLNVNSMPPFLWAALLGRTNVAENYEAGKGELAVTSTKGFRPDGGEIIVNGERGRYSSATADRFLGVSLKKGHSQGSWVLPKLAYDLASYNYLSPRAGRNGWVEMASVSTIKEVAALGSQQPVREEDLDRILDVLTAFGHRSSNSGWLAATRVEDEVNPESFNEERGGQPIRVRNPEYFNVGSVVRLEVGGIGEYGIVNRVRGSIIYLLEAVSQIYPFHVSTLRAEMRHPVNINSASKEVMVLTMEGLEYSPSASSSREERRVSAELAEEIADVIIKNRPLRGISHFGELLKALYFQKRGKIGEYGGYESLERVAWAPRIVAGGNKAPARFVEVEPTAVDTGRDPGRSAPMSSDMAAAIMQNAINPSHRFLVSSTMPFCFTSGDYFRVETAASVNDAAGSELGTHRQRETFKTAPATELAYRLDSQLDFEGPIMAGRTGRRVETHPRPLARYSGPRSNPEPRLLRFFSNFEQGSRPSVYPSQSDGDVRLQPARVETPIAGDYEEHFDGDIQGVIARGITSRPTGIRPEWILPEGFEVGNNLYSLPLNGGQGSNGTVRGLTPFTFSNPNSGVVADQDGLLPFVLQFWIKPYDFRGAPEFLNITGNDPATDYLRVWYDPSDRSVHAKLHDRTLDGGNNFEEAAEVVWNAPGGQIEDQTWYHIALHVGGTRPEQLSLHVDGFKRGEAKFKSKLVSAMSQDDLNFEVEDATGWPDHGVFWIGLELVQAERNGPNSFQVLDNQNPQPQLGVDANGQPILAPVVPSGRGARSTEARAHSQGEGVRLFGYTVALTRANGDAGVALDIGGGNLASPLAPFDICAIADDDTTTATLPIMGNPGNPGQPNSVGVRVLNLNTSNRIKLDSFAQPGQLQREHEAFQVSGGYGFVLSLATDGNMLQTSNSGAMVAQIFRYDQRQGTTLMGVSPVSAALSFGLQTSLGVASLFTNTLAPMIVTRRTNNGNADIRLAAVIPLSIHLTNVNGYQDPGAQGGLGGAAANLFAEFIQLGRPNAVPTPGNFASHDIEWLRYYAVDRQNSMLVHTGINELTQIVSVLGLGLHAGDIAQGGSMNNKPGLDRVMNVLRFRGQASTRQFGYDVRDGIFQVHGPGSPVIPVFRVANADFFSATLGYGDPITLLDAQTSSREKRFVSWSWVPPASATAGPYALAALTENVVTPVTQIAITTSTGGTTNFITNYRDLSRALKFPSGELPFITPSSQANIGSGASGQVGGGVLIDEIQLRGLDGREFVLWDDDIIFPVGAGATAGSTPFPLGIDDAATSIPVVQSRTLGLRRGSVQTNPVNQTTRWLPDGREILSTTGPGGIMQSQAGLVQIDDEIIAYREITVNNFGIPVLEDCERGYMGTEPAEHSFGSNVVYLDWRAVTRLQRGAEPDNYDLAVTGTRNFNPFGGTALIRDELIHYTELAGSTLRMPLRTVDGVAEGLFRGRFGTKRGSYPQDELVLGMPFRYWDRFALQSDDPALAYYEFAVNEPRAFFKRLSWRHRFRKSNLDIKMLCRFDPTVPWETPIAKSKGRLILLESESGRSEEQVNHHRLMISGKGMEVRVFFTWKPGAVDTQNMQVNSWKETPELLEIDLRYLAAPQVLFRETLE
ncbi:MAG: hypothetical protein V3W41_10275 [Planctomycetota bacterium]